MTTEQATACRQEVATLARSVLRTRRGHYKTHYIQFGRQGQGQGPG